MLIFCGRKVNNSLEKIVKIVRDVVVLSVCKWVFLFVLFCMSLGPLPVGDISFNTPLMDQFLNTVSYFGNTIFLFKRQKK